MASTKATKEPGIQFIEGIKGSYYRVQIRLKGCPHLSKNYDTFEEWSDLVRSAIVWIGMEDPSKSRREIENTDPVRLAIKTLFSAWYCCF